MASLSRAAGSGFSGARLALVLAAWAVLLGGGLASAGPPRWRTAAPVPVARTEVAAALFGQEIAVVGGFLGTARTPLAPTPTLLAGTAGVGCRTCPPG